MEKIKFPLIFNECPNCHSTRKVVDEVKKQAGQPQEPQQALTMIPTPVATEAQMMLGVPVPWLTAALAVCADCGTVYCTTATVETRIPKMKRN